MFLLTLAAFFAAGRDEKGGKRAYTFVTRRLIGWSDREGAGDRQL